MSNEQTEKSIAHRSALIYIPISLGSSLIFLFTSTLKGDYPPVAQVGGMIWVALLSLIVSMPLVISRVKRQYLVHQEDSL